MEKEDGMVRFRVVFDDCSLLSKSQISDGFSRCWLLLKPGIATFADLASHLRETFAFRERLVLYIDDFVLPPFESTRIIKDNDIIRVKQKELKDSYKHCDGQKTSEDCQIAMANCWAPSNSITVDETFQENSQQIGNTDEKKLFSHTENAVHEGNSSWDSMMMKQKRDQFVLVDKKIKKRLKASIDEKLVSCTEDVQTDELLTDQINNHGSGSKLHIAKDVTKEIGHISGESSEVEKRRLTENFRGGNGGSYCNKKSSGSSSANGARFDRKSKGTPEKAMPAKQRIDIGTLFLLTRQPMEGDILAYRYVEPSSEYLELSSPQVGFISAFDRESMEISLMPVHEFEVFSKDNPKSVVSQQRSSLHKEDGFIVINFSKLFDVRLLKSHDSKDSVCSQEGTLIQARKGNCEADLAESSWNLSNAYNGEKDNTLSKSTPSESKGSSSRPHGASPAANFFWETYLSKGKFNKGGKCSRSGKY